MVASPSAKFGFKKPYDLCSLPSNVSKAHILPSARHQNTGPLAIRLVSRQRARTLPHVCHLVVGARLGLKLDQEANAMAGYLQSHGWPQFSLD